MCITGDERIVKKEFFVQKVFSYLLFIHELDRLAIKCTVKNTTSSNIQATIELHN